MSLRSCVGITSAIHLALLSLAPAHDIDLKLGASVRSPSPPHLTHLRQAQEQVAPKGPPYEARAPTTAPSFIDWRCFYFFIDTFTLSD
jgi:hypothetical protein